MPEDEYARAKIEEHSSRMDRHDTLFDKLFEAMNAANQWRAKYGVYILIGSVLVSWVIFHLLGFYFEVKSR